MKKEKSTNSLASNSLANGSSACMSHSSVRFGSVEVHTHGFELNRGIVSGGSILPLSNGPSITLGWERLSYDKFDSIDAYQKQKNMDTCYNRHNSHYHPTAWTQLQYNDNNDNDNAHRPSSLSFNNNKSRSTSQHSSILRPVPAEERVERLLDIGYTYREILISIREGEGCVKKGFKKTKKNKQSTTTTSTRTRTSMKLQTVVLNMGKLFSKLCICKNKHKNKK